MEQNDRLDELLQSVLRPYSLKARPRPQLSLFLHLDTVIAWYAQVVKMEMIHKVDETLQVSTRPGSSCLI